MFVTKRAAIITNDCRLLSNFNQQNCIENYVDHHQYHSINLNQSSNYKYEAASKFMHSKSIKNLYDNIRIKNVTAACQNGTTVDFHNINNYQKNINGSYLWRKNDLLPQNSKFEKEWNNKNIFEIENLNKSTLSLHIEAYENQFCVQQKTFDKETIKIDLKESKQDPFGFPRQQKQQQQKEKELMEATEMMAFKFSTKLCNINAFKDKPMPHLYKQYIRIIAKWPKDNFKNEQRNLGYFFEKELEKIFHQNSVPPESGICERRLKALIELAESRHQHDFPHQYKSGIFGLKLKELNEINSDECRKQIGLGEPKKTLFSKLFFGRK